jgi:hypothetical protein
MKNMGFTGKDEKYGDSPVKMKKTELTGKDEKDGIYR